MLVFLSRLIGAIDRFTSLLGRAVSWLTLLMVITTCVVVLLRYGFNIGSIALQESVSYMHAAVFLLCAGYTLQQGGQVRVDIFYRRWQRRQKAWVDALGTLILLLPFCVFLLFVSWEFVLRAWQIGEISAEPGGIPAVFLLKTLIPLGALSLALQGLAELLRNLLILLGASAEQERAA